MRYWLSFDVGFLGVPFDPLYRWLADNNAEECGAFLATFRSEKTREQLADELKRVVGAVLGTLPIPMQMRFYIISKTGGRFILGSRKQAPWAGYSSTGKQVEDTD